MQQDKPRCAWAKSPLMQAYHDTEWGVPTRDDGRLYEMLLLEAFQAGAFLAGYPQQEGELPPRIRRL